MMGRFKNLAKWFAVAFCLAVSSCAPHPPSSSIASSTQQDGSSSHLDSASLDLLEIKFFENAAEDLDQQSPLAAGASYVLGIGGGGADDMFYGLSVSFDLPGPLVYSFDDHPSEPIEEGYCFDVGRGYLRYFFVNFPPVEREYKLTVSSSTQSKTISVKAVASQVETDYDLDAEVLVGQTIHIRKSGIIESYDDYLESGVGADFIASEDYFNDHAIFIFTDMLDMNMAAPCFVIDGVTYFHHLWLYSNDHFETDHAVVLGAKRTENGFGSHKSFYIPGMDIPRVGETAVPA